MNEHMPYSSAMQIACKEARLWLGSTSPNPPVGAVGLDFGGKVIAVAAHKRAGEAHAERILIEQCRKQSIIEKLHTLCITLSPCNHHGLTPPCCDLILETGIRCVVIGTVDPNPIAGGAIERLRSSGIEVRTGVEENLCRQLIYAFSHSIKTGKPWITIKRAIDEKGSMIPPKSKKTFTSNPSLILAHRLRKRADAILTGSGTILSDNPLFTARHVPDYEGKKRFLAILDRRRRIPQEWIDHAIKRNLQPIIYDDLQEAIDDLAKNKVREILVEAGPLLSSSLLEKGLWTQLITIKKGNPDIVETTFNPNIEMPFNTKNWEIENTLPL